MRSGQSTAGKRPSSVALDLVSEAVFEVDADARVLFVNRAGSALLGVGEQDPLPADLGALVVPGDEPLARRMLRQALDGSGGIVRMRLRRRDGSAVDVDARSAPVAIEGRPAGMALSALPAPARGEGHSVHPAERALAEREEQFRALLGATPDLLSIKDGAGRWLEANAAMLDVFQLDGTAYQGKTDAELGDLAPFHREALRACAASDEETWRAGGLHRSEDTVQVPGGSPRVFDVIKAPLLNPDGSRRALLVIAREVTENKQREDQVRHAQKLEALGRLAAGIAHDFNNLLTAINGFAGLAMAAAPAGALRDYLREVLAAAGRASDLTRNLLAFGRRQVVAPRDVHLNELLERMCSVLRAMVGERVELCLEPCASPDWVRVDPAQLEQVVLNLALNSRDAMPSGGRLLLRTLNVPLEPRGPGTTAAAEGEQVVLEVTDTGTGMDAAVRARLFEPFFTTKPKGQGTGLGLATSYGIVRQAGGQLTAESQPGRGSTFRVSLPRGRPPVPEGEAPEKPAAEAGGTVLVVEDNDALRHLAAQALTRVGCEVLSVARGRDALAVERDHPGRIDLLFTDVALPDMSGQDVAEALVGRRPGLRVLFASGRPDELHAATDEPYRSAAPLPKPYQAESLVARVRAALGAAARPPTA